MTDHPNFCGYTCLLEFPNNRMRFETVFERMENPKPVGERGNWIGYRLRPAEE